MNHLNGVCIVTTDVPRLSQFYAQALQAQAEGDDTYATLAVNGATLAFCAVSIMEGMAPGSMDGAGAGAVVLEARVDDVDAAYERMLALGAPVVKPPTTQPWGWRSAWFRDPDGNVLNLCAPAAQTSA